MASSWEAGGKPSVLWVFSPWLHPYTRKTSRITSSPFSEPLKKMEVHTFSLESPCPQWKSTELGSVGSTCVGLGWGQLGWVSWAGRSSGQAQGNIDPRAAGGKPFIFPVVYALTGLSRRHLQMGSLAVSNRLTVIYWFGDLTTHFHEMLVYTWFFSWPVGR